MPSNEFLNLEGDKISTSRNWAVWLHEYLRDFPGKQDVLRYVLTANAPETKDNDFTWKDFQARNNNELVAVYGNFVNRALQLTQKYYDGVVPACGELTEYDRQTLDEFKDVKAKVEELLDAFKFRDAQKEAMNLARIGNKYIADSEPWKVVKTDPERVKTIIYISLQLTANLAIAFEPFLPFSSEKLRKMLNMESFEWNRLGRTDLLQAGHRLAKPELLFEKIEDDVIEAQVQKLLDTKKPMRKPTIRPSPSARISHLRTSEAGHPCGDGVGMHQSAQSGQTVVLQDCRRVGKPHDCERYLQILQARGTGGQAGLLHCQSCSPAN